MVIRAATGTLAPAAERGGTQQEAHGMDAVTPDHAQQSGAGAMAPAAGPGQFAGWHWCSCSQNTF